MLSVLVVEFFICWTPLYTIHTWSLFDPETIYKKLGTGVISGVHLLSYVSSCCNPITYCFMHDKYRQAFRNVMGCRKRKRWSSSRVSENSIGSGRATTEVLDKTNGDLPSPCNLHLQSLTRNGTTQEADN